MSQPKSPDHERIDDLHNLLANRHSRATLLYFRESSSEVASVSEIAEEISDQGGEEHARIQLHHYALPRLDAADVVDYDPRSNTARYRGHSDLDVLKQNIAKL